MKYSHGLRYLRTVSVISVALVALGSLTFLSRAGTTSTSLTITNNSSREIRNVYSSHVDADDWSGDLLSTPVTVAHAATISDIACDGQQVKVIAEDQDGCFLTTVISCGSSGSWTVTDETARDCGY